MAGKDVFACLVLWLTGFLCVMGCFYDSDVLAIPVLYLDL
jgi:hypothetical protein